MKLIGLLVTMIFCSSLLHAKDKRPNILIVISDDTAFADIESFGSEIKTPALDELSKKGISFTNFHVSPVCSVTRSELITGAPNVKVGLAGFDYSVYPPAKGKKGYEGYLTNNALAISQLLKNNGYHTNMVGKWHLGGHEGGKGPWEWGFENSFGILTGGSNHWNTKAMTPDVHSKKNIDAIAAGKMIGVPDEWWHQNGKTFKRPTGIYSNELYVNKIIEFMRKNEGDGKPWLSWVAYQTGHMPLQAPRTGVNKYYKKYLKLGYEGLKKSRYKQMKRLGLISKSAKQAPPNDLTTRWNKLSKSKKMEQAKIMATFAAMIEDQDYHTGRIIDYLDKTNQLDNTLVVFLSDNGPEGFQVDHPKTGNPFMVEWMKANFDQTFDGIGSENSFNYLGTSWANAATGDFSWWKWFIGEGGIRVPLIIAPPGAYKNKYKRAGQKSNAVMSVRDLPMTILEYAQVKHPGARYKGRKVVMPEGISAKNFLEGRTNVVRTEKQAWAFELFGNMYVMSGNYKAIKVRPGMFGNGKWRLYDVVKDPSESRDLAKKDPKRLNKMIEFYGNYAKENGIVEVENSWSPFKALSGDLDKSSTAH